MTDLNHPSCGVSRKELIFLHDTPQVCAQIERSETPETAAASLITELSHSGTLRIESQGYGENLNGFIDTQVLFTNRAGDATQGRGKGLGPQSLASGVFECFEHAVSDGVIDEHPPSQYIERVDFDLKNEDIRIRKAADIDSPGLLFSRLREGVPNDVILPAAVYDYRYTGNDLPALALHRTSNGYAAGATVFDAILHALCELIERDALSNLLLDSIRNYDIVDQVTNYRPLGRYEIGTAGEVGAAVSQALNEGIRIWKLPSRCAHVVLAESGEKDQWGRVDLGLGCSFNEYYAIQRAILELFQERSTSRDDLTSDPDSESCHINSRHFSTFPNLLRAAKGVFPNSWSEEELTPSSPFPLISLGDTRSITLHIANELWESHGIEVLYREIPTPLGSAKLVQVACPGFETFHHIRSFIPCEPTGRSRTIESVKLCRERT